MAETRSESNDPVAVVDPIADRPGWLEWKRHGLGGTDVGAIAGVHPYRTGWDVYWDHILGEEGDDPSEAALWGRLLEDAVADEWGRRHGVETVRPAPVVDAEHPWRRGTPDRVLTGAVLEVKTVGEWAWNISWNGGLDIPPHHQAQAQWYAGLLDVDEVHFAVLVAGRRLESFTMPRDDRAIERLRAIADTFWHDHIEAEVPPDPDGSSDTRRSLDDLYPAPADPPVSCVLPVTAGLLVNDYNAAAREIKRLTELQGEAGNKLRLLLGERGATDGYLLGMDDVPAVTYRPNRAVDWDRLVAELGEASIADARRPGYDTKLAEQLIGAKVLDHYRYIPPEPTRVLRVRSD